MVDKDTDMKICNIYIAESEDLTAGATDSKRAKYLKIINGAKQGIAKMLIILAGLIAHQLLKGAIIRGEVKPKEGVEASLLNIQRAHSELQEKQANPNTESDSMSTEQAGDKLYSDVQSLINQLEEVDPESAKLIAAEIAEESAKIASIDSPDEMAELRNAFLSRSKEKLEEAVNIAVTV